MRDVVSRESMIDIPKGKTLGMRPRHAISTVKNINKNKGHNH